MSNKGFIDRSDHNWHNYCSFLFIIFLMIFGCCANHLYTSSHEFGQFASLHMRAPRKYIGRSGTRTRYPRALSQPRYQWAKLAPRMKLSPISSPKNHLLPLTGVGCSLSHLPFSIANMWLFECGLRFCFYNGKVLCNNIILMMQNKMLTSSHILQFRMQSLTIIISKIVSRFPHVRHV